MNDVLKKVEIKGDIFQIDNKIVPIENRIIPFEGDSSIEILTSFTLEAASGLLELDDCKIWFKENILIEANFQKN